MINFTNISIPLPALNKQLISRWIKAVAKGYGKKTAPITYIFCDDEKILEVNRQYLQHDFYTDIISFDYSEKDSISGDIFISIDTVKSNAESLGIDFGDELHRVIIHGVLHFCGLQDGTSEEEKQMREAEDEALEVLKTLETSA